MQKLVEWGITRERVLDDGARVRRALLYAMIVGVPVIFLRSANDPFNVPKLSWLVICLSLVAGLRGIEALQGRSLRPLQQMWVPAALIAGPLAIAWLLGPYRGWSLFGYYGRFQGLVPYLLVILAGILVFDGFVGRALNLCWAMVISGAVAGGYSLLQVVGLDPFDWSASQTSTIGNTNFAGGFLAITSMLAILLWFTDPARRSTIWKLSILIAGGLLVSQSEGGYAAAVAGAAFFLGSIYEPRWRLARLAGVVAAALVAVTVIGAVVFSMLSPDNGSVPGTVAQRALWWRGAISMAADSPIVGRGPNAYAIDGIRYRPPEDSIRHNIDISDDTHSVPLAMLTGAGLLGLAGFIGVGVWCVRRFFRADRSLFALGFLSAIVAYYVQSLLSIDELTLRFTLWVLVGGLVASTVPSASVEPERRPPTKKKQKAKKIAPGRRSTTPLLNPVGVGAIAVLSIAGVVWGSLFLISDLKARSAFVSYQSDPLTAHRKIGSAGSLRDELRYRHIDAFSLAQAAVTGRALNLDLAEEAIRSFEFTQDLPFSPAVLDKARSLQSFSEVVVAYRDEASEAWAEAVELDPLNIWVLQRAAEAWTENAAYGKLVDTIDPLMDRLGTYGNGLWLYLAHAHAQLGELDRAATALANTDESVADQKLAIDTRELIGQN